MPRHPDLTLQQRAALILQRCKDGKPKHGVFKEAAEEFSFHKSTPAQLWRQLQKTAAVGTVQDLTSNQKEK